MIIDTFGYAAPTSLDEAVQALAADPAAQPLAGGDGLLTLLKRGQARPSALVDLRRIGELRGVHLFGDGKLRIGAMTTLSALLADPAVRLSHLPGVLGDAVSLVGDPQARNRATVGGSLAAGHPGSDLAAALLALAATVNVIGPDSHRSVPVADLLDPDGAGRLGHAELIISVDLPPAEPGSGYQRLADRATLDAVCGVAATVALAADGTLARCRLAVTGATAFPGRLGATERDLVGAAVPVVVPPVTAAFADDRHGSAEYRAELTRVLAGRAIARAVARARSA
jgi:aerobic carbon-monoxide dehydrogenase medium subunit